MGYYDRRINKAVKTAGIIDGSEQTRIVFFSDCHRGDGSWSDSFLHNKILYQAALDYYWINGFTYVEVGDGAVGKPELPAHIRSAWRYFPQPAPVCRIRQTVYDSRQSR